MKHKRFLGIPIPVVAVTLAILLVGGGVLAAFFMQRDIPTTISIVGVDEAEVYQDSECTILLTDLAFGDIMPGETTGTMTFYVKNNSDPSGSPFYVALSQTGLDLMLTLVEDANGVVPADPDVLPLVTGSDYEDGYWQAGSPVTTILGGIDASADLIEVASIDGFPSSSLLYCEGEIIFYASLRQYVAEGAEIPGYWQDTAMTSTVLVYMTSSSDFIAIVPGTFPDTGTVRVDNEIISYSSIEVVNSERHELTGIVRGLDGTTATTHNADIAVTWVEWVEPIPGDAEILAAFTGCIRGAEETTAAAHGEVEISQAGWVEETGGSLYELYPGEILPVTVYLEADLAIARGDFPFITIILAQDSPF